MSKIKRFLDGIGTMALILFIFIPLMIVILFLDLIILCINNIIKIIFKNSAHTIGYISDSIFKADDYYE